MEIFRKDIIWFIDKIKNNEYFSYSRWNDGEWFCLKKYPGSNCDKHKYFPKLGELLKKALQDPKNALASQNEKYIFESGLWWDSQSSINNDYKKYNMKVRFHKGDLIHEIKNKPAYWIELINCLNLKSVVIIGPNYLKKYKPLKYDYFITIPNINCFLYANEIIKQINSIINNESKNFVFIFAASMTTNYIIDYFFKKYENKHFMLDFGSAFDIFIEDPIFNNAGRRRSPSRGVNREKLLAQYPKEWRVFN